MYKKLIAFVMLIPSVVPAWSAQEFQPKMAASHVEVTRDSQGISACAVRTFAWVEVGETTRRYDMTAFIRADLLGVLRLTTSEIATRSIDDPGVSFIEKVPAPVSLMWAPDSEKVSVQMPTEIVVDGGAYVFPDVRFAAHVLVRAGNGKLMRLMYRYPGDDEDMTVAVAAPLSNEEHAELSACYDAVLKRANNDHEKRFGMRPSSSFERKLSQP